MATTYRPRPSLGSSGRRPLANMGRNSASPFRHVDLVLVVCTGIVALFGAVMVYSTTRGPTPPYDLSYLKRVVMFLVIGGVVMVGAALFDYRRLRDYWPFIYGGSTLLLLLVLIPGIGSTKKGT